MEVFNRLPWRQTVGVSTDLVGTPYVADELHRESRKVGVISVGEPGKVIGTVQLAPLHMPPTGSGVATKISAISSSGEGDESFADHDARAAVGNKVEVVANGGVESGNRRPRYPGDAGNVMVVRIGIRVGTRIHRHTRRCAGGLPVDGESGAVLTGDVRLPNHRLWGTSAHTVARWPKRTFFASSSMGRSRHSSPTAKPRCTAGRAWMVSNQRLRWGESSSDCPCRLYGTIHGQGRHVGDRIVSSEELADRQSVCSSLRTGGWFRWCTGQWRTGLGPMRIGESDAPDQASVRGSPSATSPTA